MKSELKKEYETLLDCLDSLYYGYSIDDKKVEKALKFVNKLLENEKNKEGNLAR